MNATQRETTEIVLHHLSVSQSLKRKQQRRNLPFAFCAALYLLSFFGGATVYELFLFFRRIGQDFTPLAVRRLVQRMSSSGLIERKFRQGRYLFVNLTDAGTRAAAYAYPLLQLKGLCFVSLKTAARELGLSPRTVRSHRYLTKVRLFGRLFVLKTTSLELHPHVEKEKIFDLFEDDIPLSLTRLLLDLPVKKGPDGEELVNIYDVIFHPSAEILLPARQEDVQKFGGQ